MSRGKGEKHLPLVHGVETGVTLVIKESRTSGQCGKWKIKEEWGQGEGRKEGEEKKGKKKGEEEEEIK